MHHYIKTPTTFMYKRPQLEVEVVSEALFSEQITILEEEREWAFIETSSDGYRGWIKEEAICCREEPFVASLMVNRPAAHLYTQEEIVYGPAMTLPYESRLKLAEPLFDENCRWVKVELPSGEYRFVLRGDLLFDPKLLNFEEACHLGRQFLGVPYTWGGRSSFGYDCSGFVQMLYRRIGICLPRDSKDQFISRCMQPTHRDNLQGGDLIFFGAHAAKISHVGFYLGNDEFIHTSTVYPAVPYLRINRLSDREWNGNGYFPYLSARTIK